MKIIIQESFEGEFKSIEMTQLEYKLQQVADKVREQLRSQIKSVEDDRVNINVDSLANMGSNSD